MEFATDVNWLRWLLATGVLVLLLGGFGLLTFRLKNGVGREGLPRRLKVKETLSLTPKHRLFIISDGVKEYTLLTGPHGDCVVASHTEKQPKKETSSS